METQFLPARHAVDRIRTDRKALRLLWLYAAILFALGGLFTIAVTGGVQLLPAVAFATLLGGLVARLKVWLSSRP